MAEFLESEALVTATVQSGTESDGSAEILLQETPSRSLMSSKKAAVC